jgi:hypothetical protein
MVADYDLSQMPNEQAEVWMSLRAEAIYGQIAAAQAERLGLPVVLGESLVSAMTQKPQASFNNG